MKKLFRLLKLAGAAFAAFKAYEAWRGTSKGDDRDATGPGGYR